MTSTGLEHVVGWAVVWVMGVIAIGLTGAAAWWFLWVGGDK